jgi:hypothetical protein
MGVLSQAEEREALDRRVYTIDPAAATRALVQPRRLGGADFDKEGPFRGFKSGHPQTPHPPEEPASAGAAASLASEHPQRPQQYALTLSSGFGIPEAAAARLTPSVVARIQDLHGVRVSVDRMQLGASRSFPMVSGIRLLVLPYCVFAWHCWL